MKSFVMFGCWNNLNTKNNGKTVGCLQNVMERLLRYLKDNNDITDIVIAGDNYYPDKIEDENGNKKKIIYINDLFKGFSSLPKDINIDMILGNHDLETNQNEDDNIYISNDRETPLTKENSECEIINNEMEAIKQEGLNIDLNLCKIKKEEGDNTMVILLDTSIYSEDGPSFMTCYNYFLKKKGMKEFSTLFELKEFQENTIKLALDREKSVIENIIIIGHHPIAGFKTKIKKGKEKIIKMNDIENIIPFLKKIYEIAGDKKYYYLCADYHSYQEGTINLNLDDGKEMVIKQYIVGTGGTKLDDDLNMTNLPTYDVNEDGLVYVMDRNEKKCGFLVCNANERLELDFRPILLDTTGGKTRKNNKNTKTKRKNKNIKTKRKNKNIKTRRYK